jgi:hypothetical protein
MKTKITKNNYIRPLKTELIDGVEYGRYFGQWKCLNCKRNWHSAYTWVSTDVDINKYKDKKGKTWYSGKDLKDKEFLIEKCNSCNSSNNSNVMINRYNYLEYAIENNIDRKPHNGHLCAKCQGGNPCQNYTE